jgi:hypothetical protein
MILRWRFLLNPLGSLNSDEVRFLRWVHGGGGRGADNFVVTRGKKCVSFEGILKFRAHLFDFDAIESVHRGTPQPWFWFLINFNQLVGLFEIQNPVIKKRQSSIVSDFVRSKVPKNRRRRMLRQLGGCVKVPMAAIATTAPTCVPLNASKESGGSGLEREDLWGCRRVNLLTTFFLYHPLNWRLGKISTPAPFQEMVFAKTRRRGLNSTMSLQQCL